MASGTGRSVGSTKTLKLVNVVPLLVTVVGTVVKETVCRAEEVLDVISVELVVVVGSVEMKKDVKVVWDSVTVVGMLTPE